MDTAVRAILRQSHTFYRDLGFVITFHTRVHEGICRLKIENMMKEVFYRPLEENALVEPSNGSLSHLCTYCNTRHHAHRYHIIYAAPKKCTVITNECEVIFCK